MNLYLRRHTGDIESYPYMETVRKEGDFDALEALANKGFLNLGSKSVFINDSGKKEARRLLALHGYEDQAPWDAYEIRPLRPGESKIAAMIETVCFPPNEAAKPEIMAQREATAPDLFYVAVHKASGEIIGFTTALAGNDPEKFDDFFVDVTNHDKEGSCLLILSVAVLPAHRHKGVARELIWELVRSQKNVKGRKVSYLTCIPENVPLYKKMGYLDMGKANSSWGGDSWNLMRIAIPG